LKGQGKILGKFIQYGNGAMGPTGPILKEKIYPAHFSREVIGRSVTTLIKQELGWMKKRVIRSICKKIERFLTDRK